MKDNFIKYNIEDIINQKLYEDKLIDESEDLEEDLLLVFNPNREAVEITLPEGKWNVYINGENAGTTAIGSRVEGLVMLDAISAMVFALK